MANLPAQILRLTKHFGRVATILTEEGETNKYFPSPCKIVKLFSKLASAEVCPTQFSLCDHLYKKIIIQKPLDDCSQAKSNRILTMGFLGGGCPYVLMTRKP